MGSSGLMDRELVVLVVRFELRLDLLQIMVLSTLGAAMHKEVLP